MKKRLLAVILAAAMTVGVLTGCGDKGNNGGASEGASSAVPKTEEGNSGAEGSSAAAASGEAITFWYMGDSSTGIQPLIDEFTQETGIAVNVQSIPWQSLSEKLLTAISSQSGPDVMQTAVSRTAELVAANAIIDMSEYVDSIEVFGKDKFFDASYESLEMDGKYYGVPWIVDVFLPFYRTDIFADAGYQEFPKTQEEFLEACKAITEKTGKYSWEINCANDYNSLFCYPYQSGSEIITKDRKPVFNGKEFVDAMNYLNSFFEAGLSSRIVDGVASDVKLTNGDVASCVGSAYLAQQLSANPDMDGKWAPAVWPKGAATNYSVYAGSNLVIASWNKNEEACVKLVEFLARPENQLKYREQTNALPAGKDAWADESLKNDPVMSVFYEQMQNAKPFPKVPEIEEIAIDCTKYFERISLGEEDVQTVMDEMNQQAEKILSNNN